ncbi:hypothetical protein PIIN_10037 [Serendipita indica DSM 11827]|uniref:HTH CENPB-type domain-containing protein n=1 Tax=Serendipita indica (strain DSM 11827) TaxID=1109443 RepID=G4TXJ4_SERID|nr:hypothetical protein PIIN_10037 [Serendipita indica DSM 11827]
MQLLNGDEENALLQWISLWGGKGMPLDSHAVRAKAMAICGQAVGKYWVERFKVRHSMMLKSTWTNSIDHSRAKTLNPTIAHDFFMKLIAEVQGSNIPASNIYNTDENGIQLVYNLGIMESLRCLLPETRRPHALLVIRAVKWPLTLSVCVQMAHPSHQWLSSRANGCPNTISPRKPACNARPRDGDG